MPYVPGVVAVVGDVHGCMDELNALMKVVIEASNPDKFIFVGDLINKGPDSDLVVGYVRSLGQLHNIEVVLIRGNHERKYLDAHKKGFVPIGSETLGEKNLEFISNSTLYHKWKVQDTEFVAVHGGIYPAYYENYPTGLRVDDAGNAVKQYFLKDSDDMLELSDPTFKQLVKAEKKWRDRTSRFDFCRYVDPKGNTVTKGQETEESKFWAEGYKGQDGYCFFGHHPFMNGPMQFQRAVGLDTGCVYGGSLTAAVISPTESGTPSIELVGVPALRAYADYQSDADA